MYTKLDNGKLNIGLEGRIDSNNVALVPGSGSERAMQMGDAIMNNLFRPIVVPNEQAIRGLFQTM